MRYAARLLAVAALLGCSDFTEADAGIVGLEITAPSSTVIDVGQTIQLTARALNRDGESVATTIEWRTADATISVGSTTGLVSGVAVGTGRVQAVSGSFASALITFSVVEPEGIRRPR